MCSKQWVMPQQRVTLSLVTSRPPSYTGTLLDRLVRCLLSCPTFRHSELSNDIDLGLFAYYYTSHCLLSLWTNVGLVLLQMPFKFTHLFVLSPCRGTLCEDCRWRQLAIGDLFCINNLYCSEIEEIHVLDFVCDVNLA